MRLSLLYCTVRIIKEYFGGDADRMRPTAAWDQAVHAGTRAAIIEPISGKSLEGRGDSQGHGQLIYKLQKMGIPETTAYKSARAYWVPATKTLILYQMETPTGRMVDPPESMVDQFIDIFGIRDQVEHIGIIDS